MIAEDDTDVFVGGYPTEVSVGTEKNISFAASRSQLMAALPTEEDCFQSARGGGSASSTLSSLDSVGGKINWTSDRFISGGKGGSQSCSMSNRETSTGSAEERGFDLPGISKVKKSLGKGDFSEVFATEMNGFGEVAVRMFRISVASRKELDELAGVVHPNLVRIHKIFTKPVHAMVMELCSNTLAEVFHSRIGEHVSAAGVPLERMAACLDIFKGVEYMHGKKILHRDISACSCFLDRSVTINSDTLRPVKLGGMMTARRYNAEHMTRWIGSVSYMSPEEMEDGHQSYGLPADVYACGILLHECASRRKPFEHLGGDGVVIDPLMAVSAISAGARPRLEEVPEPGDGESGSRDELIGLMEKAWSSQISNRPTISIMRAKLTRILGQWK